MRASLARRHGRTRTGTGRCRGCGLSIRFARAAVASRAKNCGAWWSDPGGCPGRRCKGGPYTRAKGLAFAGRPCHVQSDLSARAETRMSLGFPTGTADKLKLAAVGSIVVALRGHGPEVSRPTGVTGSVALYSDALESIVNLITAVVALYAIHVAAAAGRPPPSVRPSQGRVFLGRARRRADRRRGAADLPRGLRCASCGRARSSEPARGSPSTALATAHQRRLVLVPDHRGAPARSPALVADGWHLLTDVVTSVGVLIGLGAGHGDRAGTILDPAARRAGRAQHPVGRLAPHARVGRAA